MITARNLIEWAVAEDEDGSWWLALCLVDGYVMDVAGPLSSKSKAERAAGAIRGVLKEKVYEGGDGITDWTGLVEACRRVADDLGMTGKLKVRSN